MAEENKHPPTTEEQTPPEMPGKAPKMEQAEIPDVGGGPAPSAKVIDLSAVRSTPEKDAPTDIPKESEAQPVSVTEYSKQEWEKPMPEPEKPKPKRGRPAKAEKAPIHLKMTLTAREPAEYSNIGINKIGSMLRAPNCPFVLFVGTKKLVKRREFEQFISLTMAI